MAMILFSRIANYVGHLFEKNLERQLINELSQQQRFDPASKYLNRPCELGELMSRTIVP
jgi:hypothetical protein